LPLLGVCVCTAGVLSLVGVLAAFALRAPAPPFAEVREVTQSSLHDRADAAVPVADLAAAPPEIPPDSQRPPHLVVRPPDKPRPSAGPAPRENAPLPRPAPDPLQLGLDALARRDYAAALALLDQAIARQPHATAYHARARVYLALQRPDDALKDCDA